jgi:hypothetical protein
MRSDSKLMRAPARGRTDMRREVVQDEQNPLDANLFDDLTSLIHYCHLCVPFVNINSKIHGLSLRDACA